MVSRLLKGNAAGGMGSPDNGPAVFHGLVGDGEVAQVVADHLRLDFHLVEGLVVVDTHHAARHLGQNDHVWQVRLHDLRLLHGRRIFPGLAQLLQQRVPLPPQAAVQPPAPARTVRLHQLPTGHVRQLVEVYAAAVNLRKVRCCFRSTSAILPVLQKAICKFFEVKVAILTCVR